MEHPSADALIRARRSITRFDADRAVSEDSIRRAVATAITAPNHKRTEPWRFVLFGPESRAELAAMNADTVRAKLGDEVAEQRRRTWAAIPAFVAVFCRRTPDDATREREDRDATAAAVQNLTLSLLSEGIGAKWTTGPVTREPAFFAMTGADPEAEAVVGLLHVGYPSEPPSPRPEGRGVDEVLTVLG